MKKITTINVNADNLKVFDSYLVAPCGRSDLFDEVLSYIITSPQLLIHFVNKKNTEIKNYVDSIPNNE